jgi:hypothetical protein
LPLFQTRTWISNIICPHLSYVQLANVGGDYTFCWFWGNFCWPLMFKPA